LVAAPVSSFSVYSILGSWTSVSIAFFLGSVVSHMMYCTHALYYITFSDYNTYNCTFTGPLMSVSECTICHETFHLVYVIVITIKVELCDVSLLYVYWRGHTAPPEKPAC